MIPRAHLTHWRARAPWPDDAQVEQDLILSRVLIELFEHPALASALAFRGGTALHKLVLPTPGRYSEDIDLVQRSNANIGPTLTAIRARLDPWLGSARWSQGEGRATLLYRFETTAIPVRSARVKVEINTREHFTVMGERRVTYEVASPWFSGTTQVPTYATEELLGTKLRALYQRKKGRDLYDLWLALSTLLVDDATVVDCFQRYMDHGGFAVWRSDFEANLRDKLSDRSFVEDLSPLIRAGDTYRATEAAEFVLRRLVARLPERPPSKRSQRKRRPPTA